MAVCIKIKMSPISYFPFVDIISLPLSLSHLQSGEK